MTTEKPNGDPKESFIGEVRHWLQDLFGMSKKDGHAPTPKEEERNKVLTLFRETLRLMRTVRLSALVLELPKINSRLEKLAHFYDPSIALLQTYKRLPLGFPHNERQLKNEVSNAFTSGFSAQYFLTYAPELNMEERRSPRDMFLLMQKLTVGQYRYLAAERVKSPRNHATFCLMLASYYFLHKGQDAEYAAVSRIPYSAWLDHSQTLLKDAEGKDVEGDDSIIDKNLALTIAQWVEQQMPMITERDTAQIVAVYDKIAQAPYSSDPVKNFLSLVNLSDPNDHRFYAETDDPTFYFAQQVLEQAQLELLEITDGGRYTLKKRQVYLQKPLRGWNNEQTLVASDVILITGPEGEVGFGLSMDHNKLRVYPLSKAKRKNNGPEETGFETPSYITNDKRGITVERLF